MKVAGHKNVSRGVETQQPRLFKPRRTPPKSNISANAVGRWLFTKSSLNSWIASQWPHPPLWPQHRSPLSLVSPKVSSSQNRMNTNGWSTPHLEISFARPASESMAWVQRLTFCEVKFLFKFTLFKIIIPWFWANWAPDNRVPDNWAPGPNCPGPNLPLFQGGQLGPEPIWYLQWYFWWFMNTFRILRWHFNVWNGVHCIFDASPGIGREHFVFWMVYPVLWTVNLIFAMIFLMIYEYFLQSKMALQCFGWCTLYFWCPIWDWVGAFCILDGFSGIVDS